ncbi:hypothetical protein CDV31_017217 [Fusarium ambrosium]|uniref:Uncharacterized protein n=1 Tax=Fusarium ambrosium TaxID=131363 RepID=A0A428RP32_9HYPO|nr:hypothetical protein CDV31_017217 [Fusarium ambrosium]
MVRNYAFLAKQEEGVTGTTSLLCCCLERRWALKIRGESLQSGAVVTQSPLYSSPTSHNLEFYRLTTPVAPLALPVLVLAAATAQVEERQLLGLSGLSGLTITLNTTCILEITGVIDCAPAINSSVPITPMSALVGW